MACSDTLYINESNVIELRSLTNTSTGALDNAATVTLTLKDGAGQQVSGDTWPVTMSLVSVSPLTGTYRCVLASTLSLSANKRYKACITINGSDNVDGYREVTYMARIRGDD